MPELDDIQAKIEVNADTDEVEKATTALGGFGDALGQIGTIAAGIGLEKLVEKMAELTTGVVAMGVKSASSLETMRIGFNSAFGEKGAGQMMNALDSLSYKTPFANEQLDKAALRLKNMGAESKNIVPFLQNVSNIAAGTGTSFEQMGSILEDVSNKYATSVQRGTISTMQLKGLANEGIPIYDALVTVLNKTGGATDALAKGNDKLSEKAKKAKEEHAALIIKYNEAATALKLLGGETDNSASNTDKHNIAVQKAKDSLALLEKETVKAGLATDKHNLAIKNAKDSLRLLESQTVNSSNASDKHSFAVQKAQQNLADLKKKLDETATAMGNVGTKTQITKDMLISGGKDISISSEQFRKALELLGSTKYANAALKQANTLTGVQKNIHAVLEDMTHDILGVDSAGTIQKGGIFDILRNAATGFFDYMEAHKDQVENVIKGFITVLMNVGEFITNDLIPIVQKFWPVVVDAFKFIVNEIHDFAMPIIAELQKIWTEHKQAIIDVAKVLGGALFLAIVGTIAVVGTLVLAITGVVQLFLQLVEVVETLPAQFSAAWQILGQNIVFFANAAKNSLFGFFNWVGDSFNKLIQMVNNFFKAFSQVPQALHNLKIPGFASGVNNFSGGPAIVGERGPELVYLPKGSSVSPNVNNSRNVNVTMNNNIHSQADMSSAIKEIGWRVNGR